MCLVLPLVFLNLAFVLLGLILFVVARLTWLLRCWCGRFAFSPYECCGLDGTIAVCFAWT